MSEVDIFSLKSVQCLWKTICSGHNFLWIQSAPGDNITQRQSAPKVNITRRQSSPGVNITRRQYAPGANIPRRQSSPGVNITRRQDAPGDNIIRRQYNPLTIWARLGQFRLKTERLSIGLFQGWVVSGANFLQVRLTPVWLVSGVGLGHIVSWGTLSLKRII